MIRISVSCDFPRYRSYAHFDVETETLNEALEALDTILNFEVDDLDDDEILESIPEGI